MGGQDKISAQFTIRPQAQLIEATQRAVVGVSRVFLT